MGCTASTIAQDLPEKLTWTRPDFDELCSKGENSLKLLNELKQTVLASWDRIASKCPHASLTPDLVYLAILVGYSKESGGDFPSIDLHLAHTLPGYSKTQSLNPALTDLCRSWEEFCNDLLSSIPKIHAIQEDIIQTASVYYQVMSDRMKLKSSDSLENEVEEAVQKNLKILAKGADFFHQIFVKVIGWVESLSQLFTSLDQEKISKLHLFAKSLNEINAYFILDKHYKDLEQLS